MTTVKVFRSFCSVILTCVIAWSCFSPPAFAASDPADSFMNGFWQGLGGFFGAVTGTVVTCYAVDVLLLPVAPPVAAYLAPMCPAIGVGVGSFAGAKAIVSVH